MAAAAIAGTCFLKVDGTQYALEGEWKVMPNNTMRTGKTGASGVLGNTVKYQVPYIEGNVSDYGGMSVQNLMNITDSTVTLELVNGKTYILSDAWYASEGVLDVISGNLPCKFEGMACRELVAA